MALDTLRAAVWTPSDVPLDRAGRRHHGRRGCPVRVELHYRRRDWWFRLGMAADRGGVVCAADGMAASHCLEQNEDGRNFWLFSQEFLQLAIWQ